MSILKEVRCPWCWTDPLYVAYHDKEWGKPVHSDEKLFEFLTLEGAQAGLSWITILRKRENYRRIFHGWDIEKIARMTDQELETILLDSGIIRNRLKVYSVRKNALVALQIQKEFGSLDAYFWRKSAEKTVQSAQSGISPESWFDIYPFVDESQNRIFPIYNFPKTWKEIVAESDISKAISKDLKKRGMSFIGSTIIYAFMQAVGMVNDHLEACSFR